MILAGRAGESVCFVFECLDQADVDNVLESFGKGLLVVFVTGVNILFPAAAFGLSCTTTR